MYGRPFPPESERTPHGSDVDVRVPKAQYRMQLRSTLFCLLWVWGGAMAAVWWIWAAVLCGQRGYPQVHFWMAVWRGLVGMSKVAIRSAIVPFLAWIVMYTIYTKHLTWDRLRANIRSPNWPAANSAQDPVFAAETYRESRAAMWEPEPAPEPEQILVPPVSIENERGEWSEPELPPMPADNGAWKLVTFLRAVMAKARPFSRAGALQHPAAMARREFDALAAWAVKMVFHEKGSGTLTPRGKRWAAQTIARMVQDNGHSPGTPDAPDNATERVLSRPSRPVQAEAGE